MTTLTSTTAMALDERRLAKEIGMSIHWLRKDRQGGRLLPFYRIGTAIRYNPERVREVLATLEEGGRPADVKAMEAIGHAIPRRGRKKAVRPPNVKAMEEGGQSTAGNGR